MINEIQIMKREERKQSLPVEKILRTVFLRAEIKKRACLETKKEKLLSGEEYKNSGCLGGHNYEAIVWGDQNNDLTCS